MTTNTSIYGILGLLTWGPKSGYDIRREARESIGHFWNESYGQIYPCLRQLVARGLAAVESTGGRGRGGRKVYRITAAGRRELRRWLAQPVRPAPIRSELCLKLCFGGLAPPEASRRHLREFRALHAGRLETWRKSEADVRRALKQEPAAVHFLLTVRMGLAVAEACVRWADEAIALLRRYERQMARSARLKRTS